jgi:hypothetical protein
MIRGRKDYDRIQDPAGLIPDDEPVFLIRGKDMVGPLTVSAWADLAAAAGADDTIVETARQHAHAMEKWQLENGSKIPDMPEGA